jgi:hypothetical protein
MSQKRFWHETCFIATIAFVITLIADLGVITYQACNGKEPEFWDSLGFFFFTSGPYALTAFIAGILLRRIKAK